MGCHLAIWRATYAKHFWVHTFQSSEEKEYVLFEYVEYVLEMKNCPGLAAGGPDAA